MIFKTLPPSKPYLFPSAPAERSVRTGESSCFVTTSSTPEPLGGSAAAADRQRDRIAITGSALHNGFILNLLRREINRLDLISRFFLFNSCQTDLLLVEIRQHACLPDKQQTEMIPR